MSRPGRDLLEFLSSAQRVGRNPLAVYLLGLCIVAGLSFLAGLIAGGEELKPVERLMPHGLVVGWYLLLFGGGLVSVIGIALRDVVVSLLVERAGLIGLGAASFVYSIALSLVRDVATAATVLAFSLACVARLWQIRRKLHMLRGRS